MVMQTFLWTTIESVTAMSFPPHYQVWFRPFEKQLAKNIAKVQGQRLNGVGQVGGGDSSLERLRNFVESIPPVRKPHPTSLNSV